MSASEGDFNLLEGWFGNIALDVYVPISINITTLTGGAHWSIPPSSTNLTIDIYSGRNGSASFIRYLLVSEMSEQFMRAQGRGWFGTGTEGSAGEGLSRFLATQFLAVNGLGSTPTGYDVSNLCWQVAAPITLTSLIRPTSVAMRGPAARYSSSGICSPSSAMASMTSIAGAGLPGLVLASGGLLGWWRRRQKIA